MIQKIILLVVFGLCLLLVGVKVVPRFSHDLNDPLGNGTSTEPGLGDVQSAEYHVASRYYVLKDYHNAELGFRKILALDGGKGRDASIALAQTLDAEGKTGEAYNMYQKQLDHASTAELMRGDPYMTFMSLVRYGELTSERGNRTKSIMLHQRLNDMMETAPTWSTGPTGAILSDQARTFVTTAQLQSSYQVMSGLIYSMDEDSIDESAAYERAVKLDPTSSSAQFCWAYALTVQRKPALASVALDRAEKYGSPKLKAMISIYRGAFLRAASRPRYRRPPVRATDRTVPKAGTR